MRRNVNLSPSHDDGRPVVYVVSQQEYEELTKKSVTNKGKVDIEKAQVAIRAFRGSGEKEATEALLADRQADKLREG